MLRAKTRRYFIWMITVLMLFCAAGGAWAAALYPGAAPGGNNADTGVSAGAIQAEVYYIGDAEPLNYQIALAVSADALSYAAGENVVISVDVAGAGWGISGVNPIVFNASPDGSFYESFSLTKPSTAPQNTVRFDVSGDTAINSYTYTVTPVQVHPTLSFTPDLLEFVAGDPTTAFDVELTSTTPGFAYDELTLWDRAAPTVAGRIISGDHINGSVFGDGSSGQGICVSHLTTKATIKSDRAGPKAAGTDTVFVSVGPNLRINDAVVAGFTADTVPLASFDITVLPYSSSPSIVLSHSAVDFERYMDAATKGAVTVSPRNWPAGDSIQALRFSYGGVTGPTVSFPANGLVVSSDSTPRITFHGSLTDVMAATIPPVRVIAYNNADPNVATVSADATLTLSISEPSTPADGTLSLSEERYVFYVGESVSRTYNGVAVKRGNVDITDSFFGSDGSLWVSLPAGTPAESVVWNGLTITASVRGTRVEISGVPLQQPLETDVLVTARSSTGETLSRVFRIVVSQRISTAVTGISFTPQTLLVPYGTEASSFLNVITTPPDGDLSAYNLTITGTGVGAPSSPAHWSGLTIQPSGGGKKVYVSGTPEDLGQTGVFTLAATKGAETVSGQFAISVASEVNAGKVNFVSDINGNKFKGLYTDYENIFDLSLSIPATSTVVRVKAPDATKFVTLSPVDRTAGRGSSSNAFETYGSAVRVYYKPSIAGRHTFNVYNENNGQLFVYYADIDTIGDEYRDDYSSGGGGGCSAGAAGAAAFLGLGACLVLRRRK